MGEAERDRERWQGERARAEGRARRRRSTRSGGREGKGECEADGRRECLQRVDLGTLIGSVGWDSRLTQAGIARPYRAVTCGPARLMRLSLVSSSSSAKALKQAML